MTPQATKDMAELGLDEQALAARQEHISQLLNGSVHEQLKASVALMDKPQSKLVGRTIEEIEHLNRISQGIEPAKPPRKKRSDAGKPKQKASAIAQQPGFLSAEQASRLTDLINSQETRRAEYDAAQDHVEFLAGRLDAARHELYDYLLELQGKGK